MALCNAYYLNLVSPLGAAARGGGGAAAGGARRARNPQSNSYSKNKTLNGERERYTCVERESDRTRTTQLSTTECRV